MRAWLIALAIGALLPLAATGQTTGCSPFTTCQPGSTSGGGGSGTVTSVSLVMPAEWSVAGSPVTTSGTFTVTEATQTANTCYAGPASGGAAAPSFRDLVDADVPDTITVDLATVATTANAGDSATAFFAAGTIEAARLPALSALSGAVTDGQVPDTITVNLAGTATALAADGTDCSAGLAPRGVDASGNAVNCTAYLAGATNYAGSASQGGPATTATALAANGTNCAAGNYARGVDASGNAENCTAEPAAGVTDHGGLTGLSDDDHGQYLFNAPAASARNTVVPSSGSVVGVTFSYPASATAAAIDLQDDGTSRFRAFPTGVVEVNTASGPRLDIRDASGSSLFGIDIQSGRTRFFQGENGTEIVRFGESGGVPLVHENVTGLLVAPTQNDRMPLSAALMEVSNEDGVTSNAVLRAKGRSSQTGDLFQAQDSSGANLFRVGADGYLTWTGEAYLAADGTNATATMATTGLSVNVTTGKKYTFKAIIYLSDSVAAEGAAIDFDGGSASATNFRTHCTGFDSALALSAQSSALATDIAVSTFTGNGMIECHGSFEPSSTGTFIPRYAQNTHVAGTLTIYRGSHLTMLEAP